MRAIRSYESAGGTPSRNSMACELAGVIAANSGSLETRGLVLRPVSRIGASETCSSLTSGGEEGVGLVTYLTSRRPTPSNITVQPATPPDSGSLADPPSRPVLPGKEAIGVREVGDFHPFAVVGDLLARARAQRHDAEEHRLGEACRV